MAVIGGFRSGPSITRKTDGNFGNVSAGVLFPKVAYQRITVVNGLSAAYIACREMARNTESGYNEESGPRL